MEKYYGFDLGDAESAIAVLSGDGDAKPEVSKPQILPVDRAESFVTAYARKTDGTILIGENACYTSDAVERGLRFKSRFLTDPDSEGDIRLFESGVISSLMRDGNLREREDSCFYLGCPAGWNKTDRERYRQIAQSAGMPPVKIISESRAALIAACQSRYLQVGYDILSKPVLVVDAGSSTTDFAYVEGGREVQLRTAGEVTLGGGLMDEMLLETAVSASGEEKKIRHVFEKIPAWRTYCEFAARKLKEKYFSDEEYWKEHVCRKTAQIFFEGETVPLTLEISRSVADRLLEAPNRKLGGRSFRQTFCESFRDVLNKIPGHKPELILLTGGVSVMPEMKKWCEAMAGDAVLIAGFEPKFAVAKGLAWSGKIDEEMRRFRKEVDELIDSSTAEQIVSKHMDELFLGMVDTLTEPILHCVAMRVFDRWKCGDIRKLSDIDENMKTEAERYLKSQEAQKLLTETISRWMKPVAYELEEYTMPICARHNVPFRTLNLTSYLSVSDVDIQIETKNIFAVDEITMMLNAIISILVGLLCGGSGIALIASGLKGIVAGAVISLTVLLAGREKLEEQMMKIDYPKTMRKLISRRQFEARIQRAVPEVKAKFYESLEKDKNKEISQRMTLEISRQIEECLYKMAEVVEIPLG